jgi:outer membrane protein TolC
MDRPCCMTVSRTATVAAALLLAAVVAGQDGTPTDVVPPVKISLPIGPAAASRTLPITLPAALKLANGNPIDIAVACERLQVALAQHERARVLWLPTIDFGADYARQDGRIQDVVGNVISTSKSSFMIGAGPSAVISTSDAVYAPLAARQVVCARRAEVEASSNDSLLHVGEAYVGVQQARGEIAGALDAAQRANELLRRVEKLAPGLIPSLEINRARADAAKRQQVIEAAFERWEVASADLVRLVRLDAAAMVEPIEPPDLRIDLVDRNRTVDELIPIALTARPELAAHQAIVQATLARLRHEKMRPLMPSVLLRGNATNPAGNLAGGYFGGGVNDNLSNFGPRNSVDLQFVWELQNLGFGNRAAVKERQAENRLAVLELFRVQDRVAADVVQAHAQTQRAANRLRFAEEEMHNAVIAADLNLQGLSQTKRIGETIVLVVRPQEVVASIAALDQAYRDYYAAVGDVNRGQFRLYRALGHPAQTAAAAVAGLEAAPPLATNAKPVAGPSQGESKSPHP